MSDALTKAQIHILKHALGLTVHKEPYRNYYVCEGPGEKQNLDIQRLVELNMLIGRKHDFMCTRYIYHVTKKGAEFLDVQLPKD